LNPDPATSTPLAIIGIGCLFPGSTDFDSYWARIKDRTDAITEVPPTHWEAADYLDADPSAPDRVYAARGGFLEAVPFSPVDFGIAPNNLEATDTSQLLGLVAARQALADAGLLHAPPEKRRRVSVLLGVTGALELVVPLGARLGHPLWRKALLEAGVEAPVADQVVRRIADGYVEWQENSFPGLLGNVVAGRIANRFDLGGTNCVVDAACASSLSAIHLAALELDAHRADVVVTGGVDTFNDIFMYMCFSKTPALSATGNARPFDAGADGTILGEGLGMLVLKRLDDARRDGDRVYAILKGMGSSSDGKGNAVYAPRAEGQIQALRSAYAVAGVRPDTIELVEGHGTGTRMGDLTEVRSLNEVYRASGRVGTWCALGSVKSQIGHTKAAAGAAGIIKAVAALYHKVLPPTIKVQHPIEGLKPGTSPFYLNTEKRPWVPSGHHPRRAAVSAFGFGGSNFHCVLEEAGPEKVCIDWDGEVQILPFAADSPEELRSQLARWPAKLSWAEVGKEAALLQQRWHPQARCRLLLVQQQGTDLDSVLASVVRKLEQDPQANSWRLPDGVFYGAGPRVGQLAILFPGQGAQYPGMLRDLICQFPAAFTTLVEANQIFARQHPGDVRLSDRIYPPGVFSDAEQAGLQEALRQTEVAQPALGAVSLGAWRVLESFGIQAEAFAGHSYGELTALCAAGRLASEDFHNLSVLRGQLMADASRQEAEAGTMLAVHASAATITEVLRAEGLQDLVLANKNAPQQVVLSGARDQIERAEAACRARQLRTTRLAVGGAFHTGFVAQACGPLGRALARRPVRGGGPRVFANSTAREYPAEVEQARTLLAGQLARPVEWVAQVERMHAGGLRDFLEVGPGSRLTGLVGAILADREHQAFALDASAGRKSGIFDLAFTLAWLASRGHRVDLILWNGRRPPVEAGNGKTGFTVPICGANYRRARTIPPRLPPAPLVPEQKPSSNGASKATMNGSNPPPKMPPRPEPAPSPPGEALTQVLQATQEAMALLQRLQEQTTQAHRQFLQGQEATQRSVQLLIEQQQRLLQAALGGAPLSLSLPAPSPPVPATPPPPPPPLPEVPPVEPEPVPRSDTPTFAPPVEPPPVPAPAVPVMQEQRSVPAPQPRGGDTGKVQQVLLEVVSEKTGYPAEMLELDMALEADLGIDSIKRVEILSALQERLPEAPTVQPEYLGTLQTLRHVTDFLAQYNLVAAGARVEENPRPFERSGADLPAPPALTRSLLKVVPLVASDRPRLPFPHGAEVWVTSDDTVLAPILARRLASVGLSPRLVPCASLSTHERPEHLAGLVLLAPAEAIRAAWLGDALLALKHAAPSLRRAGQQGAAVLVTVSRLDGHFGLGNLDPQRLPLDGGLAGLAKTARYEWPEVKCKALDLAAGLTPEEATQRILEEVLTQGPVEVGLSREGPIILERVVSPLPASAPATRLFHPGDLVVVSGGARGVTAEVAVALARAYQPTLLLLGRSPEPQPEPDWLIPLESDIDIKRELSKRAPRDNPLPWVAENHRHIRAWREIRQTLARIEAAGARALYRSVDIRDAERVASLVASCQQQLGPVRGLIHGAGVLADARIEDKTAEQFDRVFSTKVAGLATLLAALDPKQLRALVLFSSSTARFGRTGQVDYAIANEVLNKVAQQQARLLPGCRVLSINWGPWDGGMVTPELKKLFASEGIDTISLPEGAAYLLHELATDCRDVEVVVLASEPSAPPEPARPPHPVRTPLPLAFARILDLHEVPVLEAHVLAGRPVLPLALTLEWLAQGAMHHHPGLLLQGCENLRLLHRVRLEERLLTLQVASGKARKEEGRYRVPVELRSVGEDGQETLHARAEILLAHALSPAPSPAPPCALDPYPHQVSAIYPELLFHGPALQGIEHVTGCGPEGITGRSQTAPPPPSWIRQPLRPYWLSDPLAIDVAFQLLCLWSREQRHAPGLPCGFARYQQFRRSFPDAGVSINVGITHATALLARADIDFLDHQGQVLARMEGCELVIDPGLARAFQDNQLREVTPLGVR
jgi:acyl transferase domain-containing protein/NAD(P)-dependent dehydrogenase (short-subunit alcohol dehydrogenase family)